MNKFGSTTALSSIHSDCDTAATADGRGLRRFAPLLATTFALGLLAACSPSPEDVVEEDADTGPAELTVYVTAAFQAAESESLAVDFVPNPNSPSLGRVISAPSDGGLDVFNTDGELIVQHAGSRLTGLAVAPDFQLRGQELPLVFGAIADTNTIGSYAFVREQNVIFEVPLADISPVDGVAGLCLLREGVGFVDLVILGDGASAEIWRVMDSGDETLSVTQRAAFALPAPARECVSDNGDILVSALSAGIARVDTEGNVLAQNSTIATSLAVNTFDGMQLVMVTNGTDGSLATFGAGDLEPFATVTIEDGLSTPGVKRPGPISVSPANFGYTAYSGGMVAVFDVHDSRVKVISLDTLGLSLFPAPEG
jgi:myo-inositol-hexaphosphate 3-phosphohydrolase